MKKSDKDKMLKNGIQSLVSRPGPNVLESMFDRTEEFVYLPLADIRLEPQPRKTFDLDSESFRGLVESVRAKGVIEPVLVNKSGREYILISGERRLKAATEVGLPTVPARIFRDIQQQEILALQLIENLNREDLNPIDEAYAYLEYYRSFDGKRKAEAQDLINGIILLRREPERADVPIIGTIVKICGKSSTSLTNLLSLIMLKNTFQEAIKKGTISPTQGYALAENRAHPRFEEIAERVLNEGLTVEKIRALFKEPALREKKTDRGRPVTFKSARKKFNGWRQGVLKAAAAYSPRERGDLAQELEDAAKTIRELK